jgi:OOP family OmpA-OmpF porin
MSVAHANVEIGGTAGVHVFSTNNELGVNDTPDANSERNSALFGLRLGVFFGPMFGVEGEFGVVPSESRQMVFDVWNITYRVQAVAQFRAGDPEARLIPFVLVGGGAFQIVDNGGSQNDNQIRKDTDAMLYVGAGAKYRVDNGWGLRADVRLLFPPSSKDSGFTEDFEALLSIYKEFGRPQIKKVVAPPVDNDPDHDGIVGDADKCPNEPEDKDGFQDEDGCPDPDNDGDGIPDVADKCPNEPETKNGYQDEDGCPDELPAKLKQFTGVIQGINFRVGDSALQASSNTTLDKAVAVLKEFGDLKLEIQGHTDDQPMKSGGKFANNLALSQARAESVKAYFVSKGIVEARLTAKGYGDTVPVEDPKALTGGKLNAARAKNRRVEFKLVSALTQ